MIAWDAVACLCAALHLASSVRTSSACSFVVANFNVDQGILAGANVLNKKRGPDATSRVDLHGWMVLHNLLWMTGQFTQQPFVEKVDRSELAAVFNGEIYNYRELLPGFSPASDGAVLLPAYRTWGLEFGKRLDGEFAIVILDISSKRLVMLTDPFGTKPLFFGSAGERFAAASYRSVLLGLGFEETDIHMAEPNTLYVASFAELRELWRMSRGQSAGTEESCGATARQCGRPRPLPPWPFVMHFPVTEWNLTQHKERTDDWIVAFHRAVAKRTRGLIWPAFVGLSSGYDSGAIQLALDLQQVPHHTFTVRGVENMSVVARRVRRSSHAIASTISLSREDYARQQRWISRNAEPFVYEDHQFQDFGVINDQASVGLGLILRRCVERGVKVYFSGHGADETISRYVTSPPLQFPDDLASIFPWPGFYYGSMRNYLMKEETLAGAYGMETRYPFLDREVVQEFLALSASVKSSAYKRPILDLFQQHAYPFRAGEKLPFVFLHTLSAGRTFTKDAESPTTTVTVTNISTTTTTTSSSTTTTTTGPQMGQDDAAPSGRGGSGASLALLASLGVAAAAAAAVGGLPAGPAVPDAACSSVFDLDSFERCCDLGHGPSWRAHCWERGGSFETCCVPFVFRDCIRPCRDDLERLRVLRVAPSMCEVGFDLHVCDMGTSPPRVVLYTQWSSGYLGQLMGMLFSLRTSGESVRLVSRRLPDTRNITTRILDPVDYSWQKRVRAKWFIDVANLNRDAIAISTDADVHYYPGWLAVIEACLAFGVDFCVGQQMGYRDDRAFSYNPGVLAFVGNDRVVEIFRNMILGGGNGSELNAFNHALVNHESVRFAVFNPGVLKTGLFTGNNHYFLLRLRIHHAASHEEPYRMKIGSIQTYARMLYPIRVLCSHAGLGRFPAHPFCLVSGETHRIKVMRPFKEGSAFDTTEISHVQWEYSQLDERCKNDRAFWWLVQDAAQTLSLELLWPSIIEGKRSFCDRKKFSAPTTLIASAPGPAASAQTASR